MTIVYWYHLPEHLDINSTGYVGITDSPKQRHWYHSTGRTNKHLANAFNKYKDLIQKEIIFEGTREECLQKEIELRPLDNIGWNICKGGGDAPSWLGKKHTQETKDKMSTIQKGKPGKPNKWKGRTGRYTEEQKAHLGSFHKGKVITEEHRKAITEKNSGENNPGAKNITLVHKDTPEILLDFSTIKEASEQLNIPYSTLRSQVRRKSKTFNRLGYKIINIGE